MLVEDYLKYLVFIFPALIVYIPSIFFPLNNAGKNVPFRPPGYVFGIVWPILFLLLGFSWFNRLDLSYLYLILSILLSTWIIIYNYSKTLSFIEIIITIIFTIFLILYKYKQDSSLLLIPLILWLVFASTLNGYEIIYKL